MNKAEVNQHWYDNFDKTFKLLTLKETKQNQKIHTFRRSHYMIVLLIK